MNVYEIGLDKLFVSNINVRKTLTSEEDETGITDLSNDIKVNGLINPITVRVSDKKDGTYEIIAGQRRFLAIRLLGRKTISCNVLDVNTQKAEEISLVENVQRNQMTTCDKIRSYSKLYEFYNRDINKVISVIHISKQTIQKYLKIENLPEEVLEKLDSSGTEKISLDVAIELSKLDNNIDKTIVLQNLETLTNAQRIETLKNFRNSNDMDIENLNDIKEKVIIKDNNMNIIEARPPYIYDKTIDKNIIIPEDMYDEILRLIKTRKNGNLVYIE